MSFCPECGGNLHYIIQTKRYVCKSCGLMLTQQDLIEMRRKLRPSFESEEQRHKRTRREYLEWWLSKKK
ncbi:MAG: hypothetical protein OEZ48_04795 [Candidatus Bathyarchaeota archaeon]|nr:hypothetical protein [Candidatus Bathyarchaeota archaeon]